MLSGQPQENSPRTQPIGLKRFSSRDKSYVFASSDRPTVVHHSNGKVLYSNVNRGEVTSVCSFHSEEFPDCLAIACQDGTMSIGQIDEIQKLHIRREPLGESPSRIAHCSQSSTFAVSTSKVVPADSDYMEEKNFLRLLDDTTFEFLDDFALDPFEIGISITSLTFTNQSSGATNGSSSGATTGGDSSSSSDSVIATDKTQYIVLGTAYALDDEPEPTRGRLLVFAEGGGMEVTVEVEEEIKTTARRPWILWKREKVKEAAVAAEVIMASEALPERQDNSF